MASSGVPWIRETELFWLVAPGCQASIVRLSDSDSGDRDRVLLAGLDSTTRDNLTLRVSYDECQTWPLSRRLYPGPAAYSDLAAAPDGTAICFYEAGVSSPYETLRLAQFNLEWLTLGGEEPD
jgi:sialidase-1